jgi:signal transduction histidine kinase
VLTVGLSWLWDPRGGFAGVGQLLSRYFLSLGMPFERWMLSLAGLAERESDPDAFIAAAASELVALPWITGVKWRTPSGEGRLGDTGTLGTPFELEGLTLTLYSRWRPSPGMMVHMGLLARLMGDYHEAKRREQAQRTLAYLQAIYETGSRVTHDVKNLLQSLRSLCAAAEARDETDPQALLRLIQRQLPQITQRLQTTLDKLDARRPAMEASTPAAQWWRGLMARYAHEDIAFDNAVDDGGVVNEEVFDSVADNLIQNALEKRRHGLCSRIRARLVSAQAQQCGFELQDDGSAVPEELVPLLFVLPVASETGLGVGLYQCRRLAQGAGYDVRLERNVDGEVTFACRPETTKVDRPPLVD